MMEIERIGEILNESLLKLGSTVTVSNAAGMFEKTLAGTQGVSCAFKANAWQVIRFEVESTPRGVWLAGIGDEGQTKVFYFRSRRLARVFAKRQLPQFMFCDYDYTPLRSVEFVTISCRLNLPACAT